MTDTKSDSMNAIPANDLKTQGRSAIDAPLAESRADLDAGRFVKESVDQHMARLAQINQSAAT